MIQFAVNIEGLDDEPTKGHWVLAVDRERVLIVHDDGSLHWHPLTKCTFLKMMNPEAPQLVIAVQPQQEGKKIPLIVLPRNGQN